MKISRLSIVVTALLLVSLVIPSPAEAGPKEDAQAVFDKFLAAFTAADAEGVIGLFAPDALHFGTTMRDVGTSAAAVRQYFAGLSTRKPGAFKASAPAPLAALVLSDSAVLLSGLWQVQRPGEPVPAEGRISLAVVKRGDRWLIAQFHNSPRPNPQ